MNHIEIILFICGYIKAIVQGEITFLTSEIVAEIWFFNLYWNCWLVLQDNFVNLYNNEPSVRTDSRFFSWVQGSLFLWVWFPNRLGVVLQSVKIPVRILKLHLRLHYCMQWLQNLELARTKLQAHLILIWKSSPWKIKDFSLWIEKSLKWIETDLTFSIFTTAVYSLKLVHHNKFLCPEHI